MIRFLKRIRIDWDKTMNVIEKKIVNDIFIDIVTKGKYPEFGSPECKCDKCMFNKVVCPSSNKPDVVGCFHGWKR